MKWPEREIGGAVYDFSHLDPFTMLVKPKSANGPEWHVRVTFGHHTFTEGCKPGDPAEGIIAIGADVRSFCPVRHGLSAHLPGIVKAAAGGRAYFSQQYNYLLVEALGGLQHPYAVFFNMEVSKAQDADVNMFVISAYEKPGLPPKNRLQAITMPTLVSKTLGLQAIVKRRSKRRSKPKQK